MVKIKKLITQVILNLKCAKFFLAVVAIMLLSACGNNSNNSNNSNKQQATSNNNKIATSSCFWTGPYTKGNPATNFAFPDTGAAYWTAKYTLPLGDKLELKGRFAHARYMSFTSYDTSGKSPTYAPINAVRDLDIKLDNASADNPFIAGNARNTTIREYTINVKSGMPASGDDSNTLSSGVADGKQSVIIYRVYVPDSGLSFTAGESLPTPVVTLSDGTVLSNTKSVCSALEAKDSYIKIPLIPANVYAGILRPGGDQYWQSQGFLPLGISAPSETSPAYLPRSFDPKVDINCYFFLKCPQTPARVGYYANLDNAYTAQFISNALKSFSSTPTTQIRPLGLTFKTGDEDKNLAVTVFRGKLPKTPVTSNGNKVMGSGDLRYWSFCTNEYYSQKVTDCVFDNQVILDPDGYYTIAISWAADRPTNATKKCGVNWLEMSDHGDGYGDMLTPPDPSQNNTHESVVIVRNMLPASNFSEAIQNVTSYTDQFSVQGEFATSYFQESVADFEARGCN